ncbi:hypothetical protein EW146_g10053 [Bondarzewia mesenterica]|uniref:Uncharacterized protein n=1 Tax=Bondarzewia mesenterica TaxID=1095465 RepID=A0A4S4L0U0_9AGAM|nr:hypothetical protein EW146_g10053 [Bondarzewia mesenterica]
MVFVGWPSRLNMASSVPRLIGWAGLHDMTQEEKPEPRGAVARSQAWIGRSASVGKEGLQCDGEWMMTRSRGKAVMEPVGTSWRVMSEEGGAGEHEKVRWDKKERKIHAVKEGRA